MSYSWETSTSTSGGSSGGGYSWEKPKKKKPTTTTSSSGGGFFSGGLGGLVGHLGGDVRDLATNFVPGIVEQGKSVGHDVWQAATWGPGQIKVGPQWGQDKHVHSDIYRNILIPQGRYYSATYGPALHGDFGKTGHMIYKHPLNPLLDVAALGTIPFGAEGFAARGAALGARVAPEATVTRLLARAAVKAEEGRFGPFGRRPGTAYYTPEGGEPIPFPVPRARTAQGRVFYDPLREAVGRAFGGRTPLLGNAARFQRDWQRMAGLKNAPYFHPLADFDKAMSPFKLSGMERYSLHIFAEYGPDAAKAADLGVPRQQLVDFYEAELAKTQAEYGAAAAKNHTNKATELKLVEKAQRRALVDLGATSPKRAAKLDKIIKNPSKHVEAAIPHAKDLWDRMGDTMERAGLLEPETRRARDLLEQRVLTGVEAPQRYTWEEAAAQGAGRGALRAAVDEYGVPASVAEAMRGGGEKPIRIQMETRINQLINKADRSGEIAHINLNDPTDRYVPSEFIPGSMSPEFGDYMRSKLLRHRAIEKELGDAIAQAPDAKTRSGFQRQLEASRRKFDKEISQVDPEYAALAAQYRDEARRGGGGPAGMTPEEMDVALNEHPFSPEFEALAAEHPGAFGQPHVGPRIKGGRGGGTGAGEVKSRAKFNAGVRFTRNQLLRGPEAWRKGYLQAYHFHIQEWQREEAIARGVALPYDGGIEYPLREGYVPMQKPGAALSRNQREAAGLNHHFENMDDDQVRGVLDNQLREMFPAEHGVSQGKEIYQVPAKFKEMMERQNKQAPWITRNLIDKPLTFWKAMTLKYRPAWLVNNIVGQHLLYLLFNPLGMKNYVESLNPKTRRQLGRALPGSHIGTASLAGESRRGSELAAAQAMHRGGLFPRAAYNSRRWFANTIGRIGDGMVKLNQEIADNQPRTAVQIRELKAVKRFQRNAEIARGELESRVKGKTLLQVAEDMTDVEKVEMLRKMNVMLGDFAQINAHWRRVLPFAAWFKVILTITKDLALDHPEKVLFISMLERAAKADPSMDLGFDSPSWLAGTIPLPMGGGDIKVGLLTQGVNPFSTPEQLANQLISILGGQRGTGPTSPLASLGPIAEMLQAQQGIDPFTGESTVSYIPGSGYQGLGAGTGFAGVGSVISGLPQYRLAQQMGVIPGYRPPKTYQTTANTALANYLGLPVRNIRRSKATEYAKKGY